MDPEKLRRILAGMGVKEISSKFADRPSLPTPTGREVVVFQRSKWDPISSAFLRELAKPVS